MENQEVFENDIYFFIKRFTEEQNIEDLKKESQTVWSGCLMYVCKNVFKKKINPLKETELIPIENNKYFNHSNYNKYNIKKVSELLDLYIYLCALYDKAITILDFCKLSGIESETIYGWGRDGQGEKASSPRVDIFKRLTKEREESLSNRLISGRSNPVGTIAVLNHYHGWSQQNAQTEPSRLTKRTAEQIATSYGGEVASIPEIPGKD